MTRVIHTGDTHLGYQQYHVPERRADFLAAFRRVAEDAVADDVDAVVHAGDLFHDRRPTLSDVLDTIDVLEVLDDAGIPFLAVVGNHEGKREAQWLDLFSSMGLATRLGAEPVVLGETAFYGLDFVPRSRRDDLDYEFESTDAEFAALVTHGLFEPFDFGSWDAERLLAEASVDFDAMLVGDNHEHESVRIDDAWLTYCGSTERVSAAERDERGYNIVTFDDEVAISRRGLDTREFVFADVDLAEGEGAERVRERVGQHHLEDAVVIVDVDGEGEPLTPAGVEEFAREEGALVARVTDHRDHAEETEVEVSFADPDQAVQERIRDLGLSEAARTIDETIRASKVADSNVADEVQARVSDLVDEADPAVFRAGGAVGEDGDGPEGADSVEAGAASADASTDGGSDPDADASNAPDEGAGPDDAAEESDASDSEAIESDASDSDAGGSDPDESDGSAASTESDSEDGATETEEPATPGEDQASMEDYL